MSSYPPPPPLPPSQPTYPTYPQPPTQPGSEQPPGWPGGDPYGGSPPPSGQRPRRGGGLLGGLAALLAAILAYGKYIVVFGKFGATLGSMLVSFGAYAFLFGPWFAAGLILKIVGHEMGHVLEIRRQGMQATAPVFIPFVGAAIFQRQHATDALHQAEIGIAGPVAGTVGATVAFVFFSLTHQPFLLLWAYLGFLINLFNLIPFGMLDGGWVMAAASKWFQVVGIVLLVLAAFFIGFSPIVLIIAVLSIPAIVERFRNDRLPYYQAVPLAARWAMSLVWLALVAYLGYATLEAHNLLRPQVATH
jgi:Zn-dependent protease